MSNRNDPLQLAQEEALRLLARLTLFVWTPVFAAGLLMRWDEPAQRPLILLVLLGLPLLGWLLSREQWSAHRRAQFAILLIMAISLPPMLLRSPRAVSTMGVAIVVTIAMMFYRLRVTLMILAVYLADVVAGLVLTSMGIVPPTAPESEQPFVYRVTTICVMFTGSGSVPACCSARCAFIAMHKRRPRSGCRPSSKRNARPSCSSGASWSARSPRA